MRRGEVLALKWKSIDFENKIVNIVEAWKTEEELGPPKWNHTRVTPIPIQTSNALLKLRDESIRMKPDYLVFCYDDGMRLGDTWWAKYFKKAMTKLNIYTKKRNLKPFFSPT